MVEEHQSRSDQRDDRTQTYAVLWARYSQIAFIIPAAVVVGLLVGKLLDYWLHTHWLFLVGIIVGAIAGFVDVIQTVLRDKDLKSR
jgi:F0F1-type ATP synthase assembly protein I